MSSIHILDKDLQNKIAAGEVVERPASVIKELIENALDAGADTIIVEVKNAGKDYIKVSDNGLGMSSEDAVLSLQPHATSKIISTEDLFSVATLGFRGEALASIAAVSTLTLTTKDAASSHGLTLTAEAGEIINQKQVGIPQGTTIEVSELFFNTPARKKHLKTNSTELGHISDIVTRYSLSRPDLSMTFVSDGRELISCPRGELRNKMVSLYGKDIAKHMIPLSYEDNLVSIFGLVAKPYLTKNDRSYQTLFINGRFVKNQAITDAVYDAYHTLLFLNRHPVCVLFLELDFSRTDVNVHPQKEIIRLENEDQVYNSVFSALRKAFATHDLIPEVDLSDSVLARKPTKHYPMQASNQTLLKESSPSDYSTSLNHSSKQDSPDKTPNQIGPLRILGQINKLYILAESPQGLLIIDQHAAQERALFEKFMADYQSGDLKIQSLIKPKMFELTAADASFLLSHLTQFQELGFDLDEHGQNTFKLTNIPSFLADKSHLVMDIIQELISLGRSYKIEDLTLDLIARKACRAAVKGGDLLTLPQMYALVDELNACQKPYSCPHGRPTIITITLAELEKKFKRIA